MIKIKPQENSKRYWQNQQKQSFAGQRFNDARERSCDYYVSLFKKEGAEIKSKYHIRLQGCLDVFPKSRRFHDIKNNIRGSFENVSDLKQYLSHLQSQIIKIKENI